MFSVLQFLIVFGFLVETFGLTFGALGGSLGPPWGTFGLWAHFWRPGGVLGTTLGHLWGPLASLLAPWGVLGTTLGHLWGPLDSLLTPWGGPWDHPGAPLDLDLSKRTKNHFFGPHVGVLL